MSNASNTARRDLVAAFAGALLVLGIGIVLGRTFPVEAPPADADADGDGDAGATVTSEATSRRDRARAARQLAMPGWVESPAGPGAAGQGTAAAARVVDPNPPPAHAQLSGPAHEPAATVERTADGGVARGSVVMTPPAVLAEARATVDRALARRTLSNVDRARLLTLLPSIAEADRAVLAQRIFEAATSGALAIEALPVAPASDVPTPR